MTTDPFTNRATGGSRGTPTPARLGRCVAVAAAASMRREIAQVQRGSQPSRTMCVGCGSATRPARCGCMGPREGIGAVEAPRDVPRVCGAAEVCLVLEISSTVPDGGLRRVAIRASAPRPGIALRGAPSGKARCRNDCACGGCIRASQSREIRSSARGNGAALPCSDVQSTAKIDKAAGPKNICLYLLSEARRVASVSHGCHDGIAQRAGASGRARAPGLQPGVRNLRAAVMYLRLH